jgi:hypothetical protein
MINGDGKNSKKIRTRLRTVRLTSFVAAEVPKNGNHAADDAGVVGVGAPRAKVAKVGRAFVLSAVNDLLFVSREEPEAADLLSSYEGGGGSVPSRASTSSSGSLSMIIGVS